MTTMHRAGPCPLFSNVPLSRGLFSLPYAHTLSSSSSLLSLAPSCTSSIVTPERTALWPGGQIPYYIETTLAVSGFPLQASDVRIAAAIDEWQRTTCLEFIECDKASCPNFRIQFFADSSCTISGIGRRIQNQINLSPQCTTGDILTLLGTAIGLLPEHNRIDRDVYISVDSSDVSLEKTNGNLLTPYDYQSIMHAGPFSHVSDGAAFRAAITAPVAVGLKQGVSIRDAEGVNHVYRSCRGPEYTPLTMSCSKPSKNTLEVGQPWTVTFWGFAAESADVLLSTDQTLTTLPSNYTILVDRVDGVGYATLTITPAGGDVGRQFSITMKARTTLPTTEEAVLSIDFDAVDAKLCFGMSPSTSCNNEPCSDTNICSCGATLSGTTCESPKDCTSSLRYGFEDGAGMGRPYIINAVAFFTQAKSAFGGTSMRLGQGSVLGSLSFKTVSSTDTAEQYGKISFYLNLDDTVDARFAFDVLDGSNSCFALERRGTGWFFGGNNMVVTEVRGRFILIDILINWVSRSAMLHMNGVLLTPTATLTAGVCLSGATNIDISGTYAHIDELSLFCGAYVQASGSAFPSISQERFAAGGAVISLTLEGKQWEAATPDALVGMVKEDVKSDAVPTMWSAAMRDAVLPVGSAVVSGQTLSVTFGAAGVGRNSFTEWFYLGEVMLKEDLGDMPLEVAGDCGSPSVESFEAVPTNFVASYTIDTAVKKVGTASAKLANGRKQTFPWYPRHPSAISYYVRDATNVGQTVLELASASETVKIFFGFANQIYVMSGSQHAPPYTVTDANAWYHIEARFDWSDAVWEMVVYIDGVAQITAPLPAVADFNWITGITMETQGDETYLDELKISCPEVKPRLTQTPCRAMNIFSTTFTFSGGSYILSTEDYAVLLPSTTTSCTGVTCANGIVCSQNSGTLLYGKKNFRQNEVQWAAGRLAQLDQSAVGFKMCYYVVSAAEMVLLDEDVTMCAATQAPATLSPPTPAPPTAIPTATPTAAPTATPTTAPTAQPTATPTTAPTLSPTISTDTPSPSNETMPPGVVTTTPEDATTPTPEGEGPGEDTDGPEGNVSVAPSTAPELGATDSGSDDGWFEIWMVAVAAGVVVLLLAAVGGVCMLKMRGGGGGGGGVGSSAASGSSGMPKSFQTSLLDPSFHEMLEEVQFSSPSPQAQGPDGVYMDGEEFGGHVPVLV